MVRLLELNNVRMLLPVVSDVPIMYKDGILIDKSLL